MAQAAISIIQVENQFGHRAVTLTPGEMSATIMWLRIEAMLLIVGTLLVRLSACFLVLRMPPVGRTKQRYARAIYMLMVFFVLISTASFFLFSLQCTPIEGLWDKSLHARCIPAKTWDMIQKINGSKSFAYTISFFKKMLTKKSPRSCHELSDS